MNSKPFFSIIVPCFNVSQTVTPTLTSIKSQTFNHFEVILIDDGSTDNTRSILMDFEFPFSIKFIHQRNLGLGAARNAGIKVSCGKFIALLDADDTWTKDKLDVSYRYIKDLSCDLLCHNEFVRNQNGKILSKNQYGPYNNFHDLLIKGNCLSPSAVILKRSVFEEIGFFTENRIFHGAEDFDFWLRMARKGYHFKYINEYLGSYVIHEDNMSKKFEYLESVERVNIKHSKNLYLDMFQYSRMLKKKFFHLYKNKLKCALTQKQYVYIFIFPLDLILLTLPINIFLIIKAKLINLT